ncbi:MAG: class I SAM-dependent RNA methyltransferase [Lachnospiraceae bacterium]|nr:class I SAM-dependent RNA methyltransferase [Lachnospiraceae bacterium]
MKKGDILTGIITDYDFPNKGSLFVCEENKQNKNADKESADSECHFKRSEEASKRKVTIKGTLPGQKVQYRVTKRKAGMAEGCVLKVLERAPIEDIAPTCPHVDYCGGCTYTTMSYENQLALKEQLVKKLLDKVLLKEGSNSADYRWEGICASPVDREYRNKMEYTFGDAYKEGPFTLGMHKKGGFYDIIDVDGCELVKPEWSRIVRFTRDFFDQRKVPYYHRMRHEGVLRSLVVRQSRATGEFLVNLVATTQWEKYGFTSAGEDGIAESASATDFKAMLKEYAEGLVRLSEDDTFSGSIAGVLYTENDTLGDVVQCDRMELLYGRDYITEEVLGLKFKVSPFSFFQTNTAGCEVLYSKAREYIMDAVTGSGTREAYQGASGSDSQGCGILYDLYSGTGTIAQMMAPVAEKVYGIEIVEEAVVAARENAKSNVLDNCEFISGDVLKALDDVETKPDMIIVDPPRDGINPKALTKILSYGVDNILYISCKPTSLARDLVTITASGYRVVRACAVDQFPRTANVETIVGIQKVS